MFQSFRVSKVSNFPEPLSRRDELIAMGDGWLPLGGFWHRSAMTGMTIVSSYDLPLTIALRVRKPPEPSPPPIQEPPDPLENPDAPVREPDPDEPAQMKNVVS